MNRRRKPEIDVRFRVLGFLLVMISVTILLAVIVREAPRLLRS